MLKKLQQHWKVSGWRLLLIIATFAIGGSLCGFAGRKILLWTGFEKGALWVVCYIILITLLWPICVLLVSIPLGQFFFFRNYITRVIGKIMGKKDHFEHISINRLAIFASGAGSNAANIINYFKEDATVQIALIVCNNAGAGVREIARNNGIELLMIDKNSLNDSNGCLAVLQENKIDLLILAGFLWKIPPVLINSFPGKIINIHPALLPLYGGKGMYGKHVHEAVIADKATRSGITIHIADEVYDHGKVLFQASCDVTPTDTPETLSAKIHQLEHLHFPAVIADYIKKQNRG